MRREVSFFNIITNCYLFVGYRRLLGHRTKDGSFSMWGKKGGDLWYILNCILCTILFTIECKRLLDTLSDSDEITQLLLEGFELTFRRVT